MEAVLGIIFGNLMIVSVVGIAAYMRSKTKKFKHEIEMKKADNAGGSSVKIENLQSRIEVLENQTQVQESDIKQLREENSFFHKLIEDKS